MVVIFDLDGTLANITHRRHHVDPKLRDDVYLWIDSSTGKEYWLYLDDVSYPKSRVRWKPNWDAFYQACDQDTPNQPICSIIRLLFYAGSKVMIWSGRSDVVREKTEQWLENHCLSDIPLKMRKDKDYTPDVELKEKWLDEYLDSGGEPISMVIDDRQRCVDMWRRRGLTCLQVAPGNF